ncbi:MAG: sulfurtransferase complex subunit TusB [Candidatus Thermoplasmatota archaeon]|nr:sulfurtransferase complex subunit TusB [Candidatus Thermoplasmatota archaeon]
MVRIAFLVLKSPTEQDPAHLMGRLSGKDDASAILVEDGVYQAIVSSAAEKLSRAAHEVLVSNEDLEARGYQVSDLKIGKAVGYEDLVDCIMERTDKTVTV